MEQNDTGLGEQVSRRVMALRLLTGLVQGALLYWLYRAGKDGFWPASAPYVMTPLFLLALMVPAVLISSLGHMAPKRTAQWTLAVAAVLLLLSLHDAWRSAGAGLLDTGLYGRPERFMPSWPLLQFGAVFVYIAHSLAMAAALDRRRIASYSSYFEMAWKLAVQLMFSVFFVGALWLVLWMGAGLFSMVKLDFFKELLQKAWFVVPVICFAWSCAMHVTDVRPSIVRGIRTLLLVLASWILPVATLIICGFLCSLPFTGLDALWGTRHATSLLLTAIAMLVVLINAAFQNGEAKAALAIRVSARTAAIVILPLTGIAIYALGLRVHDYGWTTDRIVAAACLVVASCYAGGYQWAAHRYDTWLCPIAKVNIATAFVVLAVLLALFTPIADPARISVNNQMARLASGRTTPEKFDFRYLRFEGQRYGQEALAQLARSDVKLVAEKATAALKTTNRWQSGKVVITAASIVDNVTVWPASAKLPASFVAQKWSDLPEPQQPQCLSGADQKCEALLLDADGDGKQEVMLFGAGYGNGVLYAEDQTGKWSLVAHLAGGCGEVRARLRAGQFALAASRWKALDIGSVRLQFLPEFAPEDCKTLKAAQ
ncbi:DUF4153 domain-containing protein [Duganella aceris]|uniref:DUF4153 domain-containing protein n=1 Tax=Duganella aceris TaxID=2703883 RepID=A0ABX0FM56_9BURK|nr:DUF4153 domain-containing protein [Duganella aceris]NGZ85606.1 DUF4153 domain-containing protein [Duganella aceris]